MDNIRLMLFLALGGVVFMLYSAWMDDYGQPVSSREQAPSVESSGPAQGPLTPASESAPPPLPNDAAALPETADFAESASTDDSRPRLAPIKVETDVLRAEISPRGASLVNLWLLDYAVTADDPEEDFQLLKENPPNMFVAQSGVHGKPRSDFPATDAIFSAEADRYELKADQDHLDVRLRWQGENGIEAIKTYRFTRGEYLIQVSGELVNRTDAPVTLRTYQLLKRTEFNDPNQQKFIRTYTGGVYYGPEVKYKKDSFKDMLKQPLETEITGGWVAMIQHYFMAAWVPPETQPRTFYTLVLDKSTTEPRYVIGQYSRPTILAAGESHSFSDRLFVGPKLPDRLARIAPGLELAVDYGWLTILAEPIHWLLSVIHGVIGNWGWSIILLTILIKVAFYKLSETSYKSMAHMRKVTPRMKALKDRYGDDKDRLNQAMMELYKKEKINPLGGCLPILIQIPVFIALYWVLLESVELRHAPFIFWLDNLTAPDPYYILPLIMGVSMFAQQKLNPPPPDPMQEKVMLALPVVFTVFFAFFPSGLVLYWTVNNLLSITQQWYITRKIEREEGRKGA